MGIRIEEITEENAKIINTCEGEFVINGRLVLSVEDGEIRYKVVETPETRKRYEEKDIDCIAWMNDPNKIIYFATVDGQIAGQIVLRRNWNQFACIDDIAVDTKFRQRGVGKALMVQAVQWARGRNLAGIMAETQDNNVAACKFYESCGFQLGGFDRFLYKGIDNVKDEIALFWYLLFEDAPPNVASD
jgi:streptothricin acetyltransferase